MRVTLPRVLLATVAGCALVGCNLTRPNSGEPAKSGLPSLVPDQPLEFSGEPKPIPAVSNGLKMLVESGTLISIDPKKPETLNAAVNALTRALEVEPENPDLYFLRATTECLAGATPQVVLHDIGLSIDSERKTRGMTLSSGRDRAILRAKMNLDSGQFQLAADDLYEAISTDFSSASDIFNDGGTKPSNVRKPCQWTRPDLDLLAQKDSSDLRREIYRVLYELQFLRSGGADKDYVAILNRLQTLSNHSGKSPLPDYLIGEVFTHRLGGLLSTANAKCISTIEPRTADCLVLDGYVRNGIQSMTRALARDPSFAPAYAERAESLYSQKEYGQAIRDYDDALRLLAPIEEKQRRGLYNDRGLAKEYGGDFTGAIADYTRSIELGCEDACGTYENRARVYGATQQYELAIMDWSNAIRKLVSVQTFGIRIDAFRTLYPEFDSVPDSVLTERLRVLFWPQMSYETFSKEFLMDANMQPTFVLVDLYLQRGDAFAQLKQSDKANRDYQRVLKAFPKFAEQYFTLSNGKAVRNQTQVGK